MKRHQRRIGMLHASKGFSRAALYAGTLSPVRVDETTKTIYGAAVMTIGNARGWGFECDGTTLRQLEALLAAKPGGATVRFKHPEMKRDDQGNLRPGDGTLTAVATLQNVRLDGNCVRADVQFGDYAHHVPGHGDVATYLLKLAAADPRKIGLSAVIDFTAEPTVANGIARRPARIHDVLAVDFTEEPAANPAGLLSVSAASAGSDSQPLSKGDPHMDPKLLEMLIALGLDPNATAEAAQAFIATLPPEKQAEITAAFPTAGATPAPAAMNATPAVVPPTAAAMARGRIATAAAAAVTTSALAGQAGAQQTPTAAPSFAAQELQRCNEIRALATAYGVDAQFAQMHIGMNSSPEVFAGAVRARLAATNTDPGGGQINVGADRNIASLSAGISDALLIRAGRTPDKPHDRAREFAGLSLMEITRGYLHAIGVQTTGMSRQQVASLAFNRGLLASQVHRFAQLAHTTSDFSNILADTINKSLRTAYTETELTWSKWARRVTNPDFRTITRAQLSEFPDLDFVPEHGEYTAGKMTDQKETYALSKFGKLIGLSWEAIVNDDLSAFNRMSTAIAQAAARKEDDVAYFVLLNNATMADTGALFNTTAVTTAGGHANLASANAAIAVAAINIGVSQMMIQRGPQGKAYLNLRPRFLLVPPAIAGTAWELVNSKTNPGNTNSNVKNRFAREDGQIPLEVIEESRLQLGVTLQTSSAAATTAAGSSTAWYLAAPTNIIDTVEVCFLEGNETPYTEEQDGYRVDGRTWKVRHVVAAKAIDYRGLWKNNGA